MILINLLFILAMMPDPGPRRGFPPRPGLYITVYDYAAGGQNCDMVDGQPECGHTALTTTGPELYGWTAACPTQWLGHIATTVVTIWGEDFYCIDSFGRPEDQRLTEINDRRVYRIDILFRPAVEHPWNQEYVPAGDWSTRREWMATFRTLREEKIQD